MRTVARAAAALSGAAGVWLALGAVAVAPGATTATRIGVLPPWWTLALAVAAFVVLVFGVRLSAARAAPLFGGWICALPWIPGHVPAVLITWQGALAGLVWTGIAVAMLASNASRVPAAWRVFMLEPRRAPWLAAVLAAGIVGVAWNGTAAWLPGGDEPHYLVITQSLLKDGDLRIENNHRQGDYFAYATVQLKPDYLRRGTDGEIYSIHAPGISALIAPAFLVGGYRGAAWFLLACCALGTALAWRLAFDVTRHAGAAWFGWASLSVALPIVAHAYTIFPDGISGVLVLVGVHSFLRAPNASWRWLALGGMALAALPWLHTRNVVIAAALGAAVTARILWAGGPALPDRLWRAGAFLAAPAAAAVAWFGYFFAIYGTFDPSAPYGGYTQTSWENLLRGVPGLLFDQQYGALAAAPVLWAGVVGTASLLFGGSRRSVLSSAAGADASVEGAPAEVIPPARLGLMLVLTVVPYLLVTASYYMWWGGTSAPARFLVPVLWTAAVPAAVAWARGTRPADRAVWLGLLAFSAFFTFAMTQAGSGLLTFTTRAASGPFQEWATRAVDLSMALPSLLRDAPAVASRQALVWIAALGAWWLLLRMVGSTASRVAAAAVPLAVLSGSVALTTSWRLRDVEPLLVDPSRRALIDAARPDGMGIAFQRVDLEGRRRRSGSYPVPQVLPLLEMRASVRNGGPEQLAGFHGLPAGEYRVRFDSPEPRQGTVRVSVGSGGLLVEEDLAALPVDREGKPWLEFALPVDVEALTVSRAAGASAAASRLSPRRLFSGPDRVSRDRAAVARRYAGADVFFTTDGQYPERGGIWLKAGSVPLVVRPRDPSRPLRLFLRNGPLQNQIDVTAGEWRESRVLSPGEETEMQWPLAAGAVASLLRVRTSQEFRPADFDAGSQDLRRLGVWIEFR